MRQRVPAQRAAAEGGAPGERAQRATHGDSACPLSGQPPKAAHPMSETTGVPMRGLCQNCGADPRGDWGTNAVPLGDVAQGTCPACGRSLTMPFNRAMVPDEAPAVEYELDDW